MQIEEALKNYPLRISITDHCNLNCFFCSNEGMDFDNRNAHEIDLEKFKFLVRTTADKGLNTLALTGGDPSVYTRINELLEFVVSQKIPKTFFHTNGIGLTKEMIDKYLIHFSKVAVSIHSINFDVWSNLTNGTKKQFKTLMENLLYLGELSKKKKVRVEIKIVPVAGINDEKNNIIEFLDFCSDNKFRFKFLNFEPIVEEHIKYSLNFSKLLELMENIGAIKLDKPTEFRGQNSYLPMNWFQYKDTKGVLIQIGCGSPDVCEPCYKSNEIFVTPELFIKPCHMDNKQFDLNKVILEKNEEALFGLILDSREFLRTKPGMNKMIWSEK